MLSLAFSIAKKLLFPGNDGAGKFTSYLLWAIIAISLFSLNNYYWYSKGKNKVLEDIRIEESKNQSKLNEIGLGVGKVYQDALKERFDELNKIKDDRRQSLYELEDKYKEVDFNAPLVIESTCPDIDRINNVIKQEQTYREERRKQLDDERARILITSQWRTYCVGSTKPECKPYQ